LHKFDKLTWIFEINGDVMILKSVRIKAVITFFAASLLTQFVQANVTILRPHSTPNTAIRIERDLNQNIMKFSKCQTSGLDTDLIGLSNCQSIGKSEGYSMESIQSRYSQLRRNKWLKRLAVFPGGAICGALLGGAYGDMLAQPFFEMGNEAFENGLEIIERTSERAAKHPLTGLVEMPLGVAVGTASASAGLLADGIGLTLIAYFASIGSAIGVPATWTLVKFFTEPSAKAQKALGHAIKEQGTTVQVRGSTDKIEKYLLAALKEVK
jgi:hypothetical protein